MIRLTILSALQNIPTAQLGDMPLLAGFPLGIRLGVFVAGACILCALTILVLRRRSKTAETLVEAEPVQFSELPQNANIVPSFDSQTDKLLQEKISDMITMSQIMMQTAPTQDIRDKNKRIVEAGYSAETMLANRREFKTLQAAHFQADPLALKLKPIVRAVAAKWSPIISKKDVTFTAHLDSKLPDHIFVDTERLKLCLDNLLACAANSTNKGRVHMHVTGEQIKDNDWQLKLIVADTGNGLNAEAAAQLNGPINNADIGSDSSVLPFKIIRDIASALGGELNLNAKQGRGTEATLTLPVKSAAIIADKDKVKPSGFLKGREVLIIEDDISSQEVLKTYLEPEGCKTYGIFDGADALKTLDMGGFDLVFMDVRMPGKNGIETTKAIRSSGKPYANIPIIAITADNTPETNARCMVAGVDLFLTKPVGSKALFEGVRFVLNISPAKLAKTG